MPSPPALLWLRLDLRLRDHPALRAALEGGRPVVPVFVWSPEEEAPWSPGTASRWWLHHSLEALAAELSRRGSRLILRRGPALDTLRDLVRETGADTVVWSRRYEPGVRARDRTVDAALRSDGLSVQTFNANLLFEPWTVATGQGRPYQVFTPFWKACLASGDPPAPEAEPKTIAAPSRWPKSLAVADLDLKPAIDRAGGLHEAWKPGEAGAEKELSRFLDGAVAAYPVGRDAPAIRGTSRLSPHLHFGEISPRVVWQAAQDRAEAEAAPGWIQGAGAWQRQLVWREFAHHLLHHFPHTSDQPLRPAFLAFPWKHDRASLRAWQSGLTGVPMVDAGMRELWTTGWMHNRVRMIAASYLVKDLLIPWQDGARWFWDTLVDADLANNTLGWQWTAGCGADAAPYFRIFNPYTQGAKFDPDGSYVRRWVPELTSVETRYVHAPHEAPTAHLAAAGIRLGRDYPHPRVDHSLARDEALAAYEIVRATRVGP